MPTYEYQCVECGAPYSETSTIEHYEAIKHMDVFCPVEGCTARMRRVFSAPAFTVQGLAKDRFKYQDKLAQNRQKVEERGVPS